MAEETTYLGPGTYRVTATIRGTVEVKQGWTMLECDLVDDAVNALGSELIDWKVEKLK